MKYNLCIAEKAENDLNSASDYISFKLMNPDAAFHLRKATDEAILSIPKYPKKHPIVQDPFLAYFNVRFVVVKNYLLFFTIDESEKIVQDSLERLAKGRTVFTIAHRLTTIRNADIILVLTENGIEETGSHEELLAKKGLYYNLYSMYANM